MTKRNWEQIGAAGGIAFVVLQLAGQALIQVGGAEPSFSAPAQDIVTFFMNRNRQLFEVGGMLSSLSAIPFVWFLGVLWATLRRHEEEPAWLSMVAFGSGLTGLAITMATGAGWGLALFRIDEGLDPEMARMLFDLGNIGFATLWVALAGMLLASSVVIIQKDALPRWIGWLGLGAAVALLIARAFWAAESSLIFIPYMLFWLWLIVTSASLMRRSGRRVQVPQSAPARAMREKERLPG